MTSVDADESGPDLTGAVRRLTAEFAGVFSEQTVAECVADSRERLGPLRIRSYEALLDELLGAAR